MDRTKAFKKAQALVAQMTVEEKASQLRYDAPAIPRLGIPAYNWWNEALHGVARAGTATSFPQAIGMAAMFDDVLLERLGDVAATEGRARFNALSDTLSSTVETAPPSSPPWPASMTNTGGSSLSGEKTGRKTLPCPRSSKSPQNAAIQHSSPADSSRRTRITRNTHFTSRNHHMAAPGFLFRL